MPRFSLLSLFDFALMPYADDFRERAVMRDVFITLLMLLLLR